MDPPSTTSNPAEDLDTLSEARSVDMGRLDLDLSLLAQPSSLGEGSSLTPALGKPFTSRLLSNSVTQSGHSDSLFFIAP